MQDNIITWNVANWVTVVLMALLGFMVLGVLTSWAKNRMAGVAPQSAAAE